MIELVAGDDPILHSVAYTVPPMSDLIAHSSAMFEFIGNDIGLAAPQVGVPLRYFVMQFGGISRVVINPTIIRKSKGTKMEVERCLSFPTERVIVSRPTRIKVHYFNLDWDERCHYMNGMNARIFQHEYDHLTGVTILNHKITTPEG